MTNLEEFKRLAFEKFKAEKRDIVPTTNPIILLYHLGWAVPNGPPFAEKDIAEMNMVFDQKGCFGRAVRAAVISQIYFPNEVFYAGEVCEDFFRTMLLSNAKPENWEDESYIAEILQYESPHAVIVWKDFQFDPLFQYIADDPKTILQLKHPRIIKHDLWKGLHASYLVSEALLLKDSQILECLQNLYYALGLYPENILVKESLAGKLFYFDKLYEANMFALEVSKNRKDAKTLWFLWQITNDEVYKNRIVSEYHLSMLNFLNNSL